MVRGTGKFKTKRGGGRNFSKDMVLDHDGVAESRSARRKAAIEYSDDSEEEEEDDGAEEQASGSGEEQEEQSDSDDPTPAGPSAPTQPELTRAERRELKKKQAAQKQASKQGPIDEDDEDADLINPNHVEKKLNISDLGNVQMTRREREAKEKQEAKDRYWKLHLAGKTDEAKSDLARLKKIREEREAAQAKRKAEAEAKAAEIEAKKKAAMNGKRV